MCSLVQVWIGFLSNYGDAVFDADDFSFIPDEARVMRLELMDERKVFAIRQDEVFKGSEFSLCEQSSSIPSGRCRCITQNFQLNIVIIHFYTKHTSV